eukprot:c12582_g6_i3.p1 GENE.c12582_g6_i3~~c12582_g6_i3.p1  ORF type:complete len:121 (-),score=16.18 c12582_g6_i3:680-1042(-)
MLLRLISKANEQAKLGLIFSFFCFLFFEHFFARKCCGAFKGFQGTVSLTMGLSSNWCTGGGDGSVHSSVMCTSATTSPFCKMLFVFCCGWGGMCVCVLLSKQHKNKVSQENKKIPKKSTS